MLHLKLLLRVLASPNEHKWVNLCLWEFPEVRRPLCWRTWYVGMESVRAIGLGLAAPPREQLASLFKSKSPCVFQTMSHLWPRYRIWRVLVFCTNLCQKSFSNFCFSILKVYIFLILCEVMNNKGDRNTFPAALKILIFELDPDPPISTLLPAEAILDFTNSLSPSDINHQVNVAAEVSLHWTSAKKRIDTMVNWGFSLKFTCTLRL